ncbi:MAG: Uma2 family endonuclease [Acidimicrobiaceae bacterium]|nr:Uma2 family endonuclease [Acidimicrobiaceae bacterium]
MDTDLPEVDYPHLPGEEHNPLMESSLHAQWVTMLVQSVHHTLAGSGHLVTGNTPFVPADGGPHTAPDLMVLPGMAGQQVGRYRIGVDGPAPSVCVEVRSPSNRQSVIERRLGRWLEAGVEEVYLIDPDDDSVWACHRTADGVEFSDALGARSEALNLTFGQVDGRLALCCPGGRAVRPGDDPFGWLVEERHRADRAELALAGMEERIITAEQKAATFERKAVELEGMSAELQRLRDRLAQLEAIPGDEP